MNIKSNQYLGNRLLVTFVFAFLFSIFLFLLNGIGIFESFSKRLSNFYYHPYGVSNDFIIVAIDEKSISSKPLGLGYRSFWSRRYYADVLNKINETNPKLIFLDIAFTRSTNGIPSDELQRFISKMENEKDKNNKYQASFDLINKNQYAYTNTVDEYFLEVLKKIDNLYGIVLTVSEKNFSPIFSRFSDYINPVMSGVKLVNHDHFYTILPYRVFNNGDELLSPAIAIAHDVIGAKDFKKSDFLDDSILLRGKNGVINVPLNKDGEMMVNYFGEPGDYKRISFVDVLKDDINESTFKDKIVLIGITTFENKEDMVLTPISNKFMPGIEVHANAIQTILDQKFLIEQDGWRLFVMLFVIMFILFYAFSGLQLGEAFLGLILAYLLYVMFGKISFRFGMVVNALYGYFAILISYFAALMYKFFVLDSDKRMLADAFGHYVSPELVNKIVANPDSVKLTGEKRILSVMFTDIKGSTTMAEGVEIDVWVKQMNEYFTVMEGVIKKYHGTIDKYEGDAIMAFWNAPVANPDHVLLAYKAAVEMRFKLSTLHNKWLKEGKPLIDFRVGINTGEALIGNFGSIDRFNYTAMGDSVNVASRLESAVNKAYGVSAAVAGFESFYAREKLSELVLRQLDIVFVPGKTVPIVVYELVGLTRFVSSEKMSQIDLYHQGLNKYFKRDFAGAITFFKQIHGDTPATLLLNRCIALAGGHPYSDVGVDEISMGFYILNK